MQFYGFGTKYIAFGTMAKVGFYPLIYLFFPIICLFVVLY